MSCAAILALPLFLSCSNSSESINQPNPDYVASVEAKNDVANLLEMAIRAKAITGAAILAASCNNGLFCQGKRDSVRKYYNLFVTKAEAFNEKAEAYQASLANLDNEMFFEKETPQPIKKKIALAYAFSVFFPSIRSNGKEMREKTMKVISFLKSDHERRILFENLSPNLQAGETNYKSWWKKFNLGELDSKAPRIYEEFYHNADSDFGAEAVDMDLGLHKITAEKGAELVEKGADLELEIAKTVLPSELVDGIKLAEDEEIISDFLQQKLATNPMTGRATIILTDPDTESPAVAAIGTNSSTGTITVSTVVGDDGKMQISVPAGNVKISAIDGTGDKNTKQLNTSEGTVVEISMPTEEKSLCSSSSSAWTGKSSSNEEDIQTGASIVGTWKAVEYEESNGISGMDPGDVIIWTFYNNGTGSAFLEYSDEELSSQTFSFTYRFNSATMRQPF